MHIMSRDSFQLGQRESICTSSLLRHAPCMHRSNSTNSSSTILQVSKSLNPRLRSPLLPILCVCPCYFTRLRGQTFASTHRKWLVVSVQLIGVPGVKSDVGESWRCQLRVQVQKLQGSSCLLLRPGYRRLSLRIHQD
jgi:hypothetical protein